MSNPIVSPGKDGWDGDACYKPFAIYDEVHNRWLLWYNCRRGRVQQISLAIHDGEDLGFPYPRHSAELATHKAEGSGDEQTLDGTCRRSLDSAAGVVTRRRGRRDQRRAPGA